MAIQTDESIDHDLPPGYPEAIAQAANAWAQVEYSINCSIWDLAGVDPALGACMTSQLVSLTSRLNALLALMKLRGTSAKLISQANKFAENARGPTEMRNRIVHDMWLGVEGDPTLAGQMAITAAKKLDYACKAVPIADLVKKVRVILECRNAAMKLRNEISAELPSLPEIPHASLHPVTERRQGQ